MALRRITLRRRPLLPVPRAFFSSNPPFPPPPPPPPPPANGPDAARPKAAPSIFKDIRDRLESSSTSPSPRRGPTNLFRPNPARGGGGATPIKDIQQMLQRFKGSDGAPSSPSTTPGATPSFQDMLRSDPGWRVPGFGDIRQQLRSPLQRQPPRSPKLPFMSNPSHSIFDRERDLQRNARADGAGKGDKDSVTLTRTYSYEELGKRLGELRPAAAAKDGKEWFSLEELQGRIAELVKLEEQEDQHGGQFPKIRQSIIGLIQQGKPAQEVSMHSMLNLGGQLQPQYTRLPPQEELLERYFHPDHMSSEEKMKLELQRVRDEFKMSENDCGSARVQIAQLTLKIKHLSAVLHKKDKHSRKGLQEMVQRRKKYLKYLRRTDWDSYCLVLSKLGLRDVPEYKAPDYKSKSTTKAKSKKSKSKSKKKRKMKA